MNWRVEEGIWRVEGYACISDIGVGMSFTICCIDVGPCHCSANGIKFELGAPLL